MFLAAFTSALQAYPQAVHANRAWLSREFASTCPHAEHRWLVKCGLILASLPRVPQRLLLDHLRACRQPRVLCPGFGELAALLQVARRSGNR